MNQLFVFDADQAQAAGGPPVVAGADEAGRGALAGPLVAAAVCFDYSGWCPQDYEALAGLNDSKLLKTERREALFAEIVPRARRIAVVLRSPLSIDERGLHRCNLDALAAALASLTPPPAVALVDGFALKDCCVPHEAVIGGDRRSAAVAAASIVAKVTRDRLMRRLHGRYPQWGFNEHVGYATPDHHRAIVSFGLCELHRRSFNSVAYQQLELGRRPCVVPADGGQLAAADTSVEE
jgi:ribonuclease HII